MKFAILVLLSLLFVAAVPLFAQSPPANDDFASPVIVPASLSSPFVYEENTYYATIAPDDPFATYIDFPNNATVWFSLTPSSSMSVRISTAGSNYDTSLFLFTDIPGSLWFVTYNDDFGGGSQSQLTLTLSAGVTYHFLVAGIQNAPGNNLVISFSQLTPPANDSIETPSLITSFPYSTSQDTNGATTATSDPFCGGSIGTVWYTYTATSDVSLVLDATQSDFNPTVSVWTGTPETLNNVVCEVTSRAVFEAHAGVTYYFMFGSWSGLQLGTLNFSLFEAPPPPPPLRLSLRFNSATVVPTSGVANFTGTITCSHESLVWIDYAQIRQKVGTTYISSPFGGYWWCTPDTSIPFQITLSPPYAELSTLFHGRSSLLLHAGKAYIAGGLYGYSYETGQFASLPLMRTVLLKAGGK